MGFVWSASPFRYRPLSHSLEGLDAEKKDVPSPRLLISLPRCVHRRQVRSHLVNLNGHIFFLLYLRRPPPLSAPLPQETSSPTSRFLYRRPTWWCTAAVTALKPARSCVPIVAQIPYATSTPNTSRYPDPPPPPPASARPPFPRRENVWFICVSGWFALLFLGAIGRILMTQRHICGC